MPQRRPPVVRRPVLLLQLSSPSAGSDAAEAAPHALQPPVRALAPLLPPEGQDVRDLTERSQLHLQTLDSETRRALQSEPFGRGLGLG